MKTAHNDCFCLEVDVANTAVTFLRVAYMAECPLNVANITERLLHAVNTTVVLDVSNKTVFLNTVNMTAIVDVASITLRFTIY